MPEYKRTEEQRNRITKLIEALQSKKYTKGRNTLRTPDGRYCCLGVACDVFAEEVNGKWQNRDGDWYFVLPGGNVQLYSASPDGIELVGSGVMPLKMNDLFGFSHGDDNNSARGNDVGILTSLNDQDVEVDWSRSGIIEELTRMRDQQVEA